MSRLTKQGVRDLNHLPGKSKGRRLDAPPPPVEAKLNCHHPLAFSEDMPDGGSLCNLCGRLIDWNGELY